MEILRFEPVKVKRENGLVKMLFESHDIVIEKEGLRYYYKNIEGNEIIVKESTFEIQNMKEVFVFFSPVQNRFMRMYLHRLADMPNNNANTIVSIVKHEIQKPVVPKVGDEIRFNGSDNSKFKYTTVGETYNVVRVEGNYIVYVDDVGNRLPVNMLIVSNVFTIVGSDKDETLYKDDDSPSLELEDFQTLIDFALDTNDIPYFNELMNEMVERGIKYDMGTA